MYCPKCGTQLPDSAVFCSSCGSQVAVRQTQADVESSIPSGSTHPAQRAAPRAQNTTPHPRRPTQARQRSSQSYQGSQTDSTRQPLSSHLYTKLGGFLAFIVYGGYVGGALLILYAILEIVPTVNLLGQVSSYSSYSSYGGTLMAAAWGALLAACAIAGIGAALCFWLSTAIKNRNPSFLRVYHIICVIELVILFITECISAGILAAIINVLAYGFVFFLWTLYFIKSVRVRTYFGSDEYLKRSPFTRNVASPQPAGTSYRSESGR